MLLGTDTAGFFDHSEYEEAKKTSDAGIQRMILRHLEKTDPELCPRPQPADAAELAVQEDHDVSNQFSAMGSLKPGIVRLWTTPFGPKP